MKTNSNTDMYFQKQTNLKIDSYTDDVPKYTQMTYQNTSKNIFNFYNSRDFYKLTSQ